MHRLDRLIARNTGASRKTVNQWCKRGVITDADGGRLRPDQKIPASELPCALRLDGTPLMLHDEYHLMLHKPVGVVTALKDGLHPTAYELVKAAPLGPELRPVGRLDLDCAGLLLWTTSGPLLHRLTHPKYKVPRTYHVALARPPATSTPPATLDDGTVPHIVSWDRIEPDTAHPALLAPDGTACLARICLDGGAYHEVKRIFAAMGSHVLALARIEHGPLSLPRDLEAGAHRVLRRAQLEGASAPG